MGESGTSISNLSSSLVRPSITQTPFHVTKPPLVILEPGLDRTAEEHDFERDGSPMVVGILAGGTTLVRVWRNDVRT